MASMPSTVATSIVADGTSVTGDVGPGVTDCPDWDGVGVLVGIGLAIGVALAHPWSGSSPVIAMVTNTQIAALLTARMINLHLRVPRRACDEQPNGM